MIIDKQEFFKIVSADEGKLLTEKDNAEYVVAKMVYVPLAMDDADIQAKYTQVDESDFELKVQAEKQDGIYTKLEIRRACRELGIENKLNMLLEASADFKNDWADAQYVDLTDAVLLEALKEGAFTEAEIENIKAICNGN